MHSFEDPYAEVLELVHPRVVFEWGPGLNTTMALKTGATVCSMEHQARFMPRGIKTERFVPRLARADSAEYVQIVPYCHADVFFVDGRRRADCIRAARTVCTDRAVLCLHDAQRERYHEALRAFPNVLFMTRGFAVASISEALISALARRNAECTR